MFIIELSGPWLPVRKLLVITTGYGSNPVEAHMFVFHALLTKATAETPKFVTRKGHVDP